MSKDYGLRIVKPLPQAIPFLINALLEKRTVKDVEVLEEQVLRIKRNDGLRDIIIYAVDAYVLGLELH